MRFTFICLLIIIFTIPLLAGDLQGLKKRIAVVDFEDRSGWGHNIGTGLSALLLPRVRHR
jgi:hypothetical protein